MVTKFYVYNLGCKVNRSESDHITATILKAGGKLVPLAEAEVIIINTCTVTAEADAKTRKAIRRSASSALQPWVIATGCAIALEQVAYEKLGERVIAQPDRLAAQKTALELLGLRNPTTETLAEPLLAIGDAFHTRMTLKVQDGCNHSCSYCIVPTARGGAKSEPLESVLAQALAAEARGVREIVVTGVNIGAYGCCAKSKNPYKSYELYELLEALLATTSKLRLRLSSLEPQHASHALLELMATSEGRLCAHLHLPLQSGCDTTLEQMYRLYNTAQFAQVVYAARELMPQLALTTDLIVGFPGESDEDFAQSLAFCTRMCFSKMHVFRYSKRPGTPAAARKDQIPAGTIAARAAAARELAVCLEAQDRTARIGKIENVLVEKPGQGRSESYHIVKTDKFIKPGTLIPLQFIESRDTLLRGIPLPDNCS